MLLRRTALILWSLVVLAPWGAGAAHAQEAEMEPGTAQQEPLIGPSTNLPMPRFVSLRRDEVFMRRGPGVDHAIEWRYVRLHMPMMVLNEFENWRKVRDVDGEEGWISAQMLSGDRYVFLQKVVGEAVQRGWPMHRRPDETSEMVAVLMPGVIAELKRCPATDPQSWCQVEVGAHSGWVRRGGLWGLVAEEIYPE